MNTTNLTPLNLHPYTIQNPTEGGLSPPHGKTRKAIIEIDGKKHHILLSKITILCEDCSEPIVDAHNLNKRFCNDCCKEHRYKRVRKWKKNHPDKEAEYQRMKNIRTNMRTGGELRVAIVNCVICGQNISMYHENSKYCQKCAKSFSQDRLHELGTRHFSPYMRRGYDYDENKGIPDWEKELIAVENELNSIGLGAKTL